MDIEFSRPRAQDAAGLAPFYHLRRNKTCDTGVLDTFLWLDYYNMKCAVVDGKALLFVMSNGGEYFSAMPYCREEELAHYFALAEQYFNQVLKKPFKIYLADEEGIEAMNLKENPRYIVREETDLKDYLYSAEDLRTLAGKKFHKKKNLVNKFTREYEGRWEYRTLSPADKMIIWGFLDQWYEERSQTEESGEESLEYEIKGIHEVLKDDGTLDFRIGGIFIDGKLEAFSMGAYNPLEKMACISIEKGNAEIPGIYQMMNQQFLLHEFPEAELVNREDDVGLEGLRRSKESYNPCGYARKYMVLQKDFAGYEAELTDHYEEQISQYEA